MTLGIFNTVRKLSVMNKTLRLYSLQKINNKTFEIICIITNFANKY